MKWWKFLNKGFSPNPNPRRDGEDYTYQENEPDDLELSDNPEIEAIKIQLKQVRKELEISKRRTDLLEKWFEEFEDLTTWMHQEGFWSDIDVDEEKPMQTYRNGLTRYKQKKEHNNETNDDDPIGRYDDDGGSMPDSPESNKHTKG
jgi:hypothetical protein